MTWPGQVVHVAWKDLRQFRGAVALYGLVVTTVTVAALTGIPEARNGLTGWIALAAVLALIGLFTQADSPSHVDAFWATRPFYPSAVLSAKVLMTALMVGLAFVAELGVLWVYDTPSGLRWGMLGSSLLVTVAVLPTTWAIAAMTTRFWQYVAVVVPCLAVQGALAVRVLHGELMPWPLAAAVVSGALALTWYAYRARSTAGARFATSGILCLVLGAPIAFPRSPSAAVPDRSIPSSFTQPTVRPVMIIPAGEHHPVTVMLLLLRGIPSNARYQMQRVDSRLIRADGSSISLTARPSILFVADRQQRLPSTVGSVTWLSDPPVSDGTRPEFNGVMSVLRDQDQMDAFLQPGARIEVHGWINMDTARLVARFPVVPGTTFTGDGRRFAVLGWDVSPLLNRGNGLNRVANITLREVNTHPNESSSEGTATEAPLFAIVNPARGQAARMSEEGKTADNLAFPLPGASATVLVVGCEPFVGGAGNPPSPIDEEWLRGAEIEVFKWVPVGGYPVTFTADASLLAWQ